MWLSIQILGDRQSLQEFERLLFLACPKQRLHFIPGFLFLGPFQFTGSVDSIAHQREEFDFALSVVVSPELAIDFPELEMRSDEGWREPQSVLERLDCGLASPQFHQRAARP